MRSLLSFRSSLLRTSNVTYARYGRFFTTKLQKNEESSYVRGSTLVDHQYDLAQLRVGDDLEIPYEITVSDAWRDHWQSVFYQQDRIHTSSKYVKKTGIHKDGNIPMPFTLVLFLASSMSHVDDTRTVYDLAFCDCIYEKPVFAGDTLHRQFTIMDIRDSSNGQNTIFDILCKLYNQDNDRVFSLEKRMYFEKLQLPMHQSTLGYKPTVSSLNQRRDFRNLIVNSSRLPDSGTFKALESGDLILHSMQRHMGYAESMSLSTQHRMTHPALYGAPRHKQMLVGGNCVVALTHAATAKELYEIVHEEVLDCHILSTLSPLESLGAMTYVQKVEQITHELEEVSCVTIGLKNIDVSRDLLNVDIPLELFTPGLRPRECSDLCERAIPQLRDKVVAHSTRKLLRPIPRAYFMPLL